MFSIYLSLKSSRFWAACSSNTTCYPLFPHQLQPCSPPVPLGDLPSFQQETSPWDRCLLRSCSGSVPDLLFSGRIQRRTLKTKRYPGNFAPGGGEGVKLLNSHFSAENIERNSEEFGWGAAEGARVQIPQGMGAECASPGWNPWDSSCKGESKLCTHGYLPVHPGR